MSPVSTLIGTPDPDDDLRRRMDALEELLRTELRSLIAATERRQQPQPESQTWVGRKISELETRISDLETMVLSLVSAYRTHTHDHTTRTGAPNQ